MKCHSCFLHLKKWAALLLLVHVLLACGYRKRGDAPPLDEFYFPTGISVHPSGRYLYVASTNWDSRYHAGQLSVVDLELALNQADLNADPYSKRAIIGAKKISSFAGFSTLSSRYSKLYVPTRENPTLHLFDLSADGAQVSCGEPPYIDSTDCDSAHSIHLVGSLFSDKTPKSALHDAYQGLIFNSQTHTQQEFFLLSHLYSGALSMFNVTPGAPMNPSGFKPQSLIGLPVDATTSVALVNTQSHRQFIYTAATLLQNGTQSITTTSSLFFFEDTQLLNQTGAQGTIMLPAEYNAGRINALLAHQAQQRLFVMLRQPDAILVIDTQDTPNGVPKNQLVQSFALERNPSVMTLVRNHFGQEFIYVASFDENSIQIIDAQYFNRVGRIYIDDAGPYGIESFDYQGKTLVAVSLFKNDQVVIIDASSADPTKHQVISAIGTPVSKKKITR